MDSYHNNFIDIIEPARKLQAKDLKKKEDREKNILKNIIFGHLKVKKKPVTSVTR
jgi:hypothetical protein